jgi:hypothetical protein
MPTATPALSLRTLQTVCAALALAVLLLALAGTLVLRARSGPPPGLPPGLLLSLTSVGIVLILLASRIRSGLLRRAAVLPGTADGAADEARVFAAYHRATLVSFALLEGTAVVGLVLEVMTGSVRYGLALYAASLVSMLVRWPRQGELARLMRRRAEPR